MNLIYFSIYRISRKKASTFWEMRKKQPPTKGAKGDVKRGVDTSMIKERSDCSFLFLTQKVWYKSPLNTDKG